MRRQHAVLFVLAAALLLTGCPHDKYTVEMEPQQLKIKRKVVVERVGEDRPQREPGPRVLTEATFDNVIPSQIGGQGYYLAGRTGFGSVHGYIERFRGQLDQASAVENRLQSAGQLVDLMIEFFADEKFGLPAELRGEQSKKLRRFAQTTLRKDVRNLALRMYLLNVGTRQAGPDGRNPNDATRGEALARAAQYLLETGYVQPTDVPTLVQIVRDPDLFEGQLRKLAIDALVRKTGVDGALAEGFVKFVEREDFQERVDSFIATTPAFKQARAEFNKAQSTQPEEQRKELSPSDWLGELANRALGPDFDVSDSDDEVVMDLAAAAEPIWTNGVWSAEGRKIHWYLRLPTVQNADPAVPVVAYALWAVPDEPAQRRQLGKVALVGEDLARYVLWVEALPKADRQRWDKFVATLKAESAQEQLDAFRDGLDSGDVLDRGTAMLLGSLDESPDGPAEGDAAPDTAPAEGRQPT